MNPIKYIIIYTGYDDRLTEIHTDKDISCKWSEEQKKGWKEVISKYEPVYLPSLILDTESTEEVKKVFEETVSMTGSNEDDPPLLNDAACFKYPEEQMNMHDIVDYLHKVDYCGCFGSIIAMYFRGNILVIEMDCESG